MPRGGSRNGKPGGLYPNRKDLQVPKSRAGINRPAPGQQYGQAAAQEQQMKAVNLTAPPAPQGAPDLMGQALDNWQPLPGDPTQTQRPDEPVTAGLDSGPGPGSEVLPQISPPDEPGLLALIQQLPFLEKMSANPQASAETRVLYRRVLAAAMERGAF